MRRARAAVDCGTNSTRLLVVDADGDVVVRRTTITRLGQAVDATGRLAEEAIARTVATIGGYRSAWSELGVADEDVRIAATSAVRDAANRDAYLDAVREQTGIRPEVLSGDEEARLSFAGALGALDIDGPGPVLLVDVGGGSTELVVGEADGTVHGLHSMQVGSVRVTERELADDPPTAARVSAARGLVETTLRDAEVRLALDGGLSSVRTVVGVAGTVTTLAALHAGVASPDDEVLHGHVIPATDIRAWSRRLLDMTVAERASLAPVTEGRADVIAAGVLVLDAVVAAADASQVVVSVADVLDGLVGAGAPARSDT